MIRDLVLMKLHAVGLARRAPADASELSGGMARRVALARAIALDPMLIMYDEPFTGLDPISLGVIGNLIRRLNDALGATSIVVTHDVQEALEIVDYVYYVSDGRDRRARHAGRDARVHRPARAPVRLRRDRRPGAVPVPGAAISREDLELSDGSMIGRGRSSARGIGHHAVDGVWRLGYASRFFALRACALGDQPSGACG